MDGESCCGFCVVRLSLHFCFYFSALYHYLNGRKGEHGEKFGVTHQIDGIRPVEHRGSASARYSINICPVVWNQQQA